MPIHPLKTLRFSIRTPQRISGILMVVIVQILCFQGQFAAAASNEKEPLDPFSQLSQKNWVTPEKFVKPTFNDLENSPPAPTTTTLAPSAPPQNASATNIPSVKQQNQPAPPPDQTQTPSSSKEPFGIEISSTAENIKLPIPLPPETINQQQPRHYEPGWMESAATARRQAFIESPKGWAPYQSTPSPSFRLSYLPGKVPPLTLPSNNSVLSPPPKKKAPTSQNATKTEEQAPDLETWKKAIKDYKTKQMEAIQSDRQTLEALQAAIKELGLQKELNFDSSLSLSPAKKETPSPDKKDSVKRTP